MKKLWLTRDKWVDNAYTLFRGKPRKTPTPDEGFYWISGKGKDSRDLVAFCRDDLEKLTTARLEPGEIAEVEFPIRLVTK